MKVIDMFEISNSLIICCTGEEIRPQTACHRIRIGANEYEVAKYDVRNTLSDNLEMYLEIDSELTPAIGEDVIILA